MKTMFIPRWLGVAAMSGLLLACANTGGVAPRSQLEFPALANADMGAAVRAADQGAAWPESTWWHAWQDPQLNRLVDRAVAGHPDLRIAQARLDQAEAQARVAGAAGQLQGDLGSAIGHQRYPRYASPSPPGGHAVWSNSVGVNLAYDLDLWGRHRAATDAALNAAQAAAAERRAVQLALHTAVVRAYVQLALQFELLDAAQALQAQAAKQRNIAVERRRAGLGTELDVTRAEAQLAASAGEVEAVGRRTALSRHQLAALTGQGPGGGNAIERPTLQLAVPVNLPAHLPMGLLGHRPDIVALRWQVESAAKGMDVAHAAFYPNVNLMGLLSLASTATFGGFLNFINDDAVGYRAGVAVSLPIFDGGRRQGQYGQAVAGYDLAVEAYHKGVLAAMQQVADQVVSLGALAREEGHAAQARDQAERAFALAERGYQAGITEYLDVLAAQSELNRQRQQVARLQSQRFEAWAQLMAALGGGMEEGEASAPTAGLAPAPSITDRQLPRAQEVPNAS